MSKKSQGKVWPYAIVLSILGIVAASVMTVVVAVQHPVEMSDMDMQNYHHYDANANDIIAAQIAFDKKYSIVYASQELNQDNAVVIYKVTDKEGMSVNDAKINIVLTRPDNRNSDIVMDTPAIENGLYVFNAGKLPLTGRWNIMAHIVVNGYERYYSLKADTRYPNVFEY
ncbi:FixH family protein [Sulfurimonas sp. HSL3-7]|uniref:FixH family protein n=1 Tax=Sulfonitrofixus jiaomeiensis TaxID=3131938 RepID=UPI0031F8FFC7